MFYGEYPQFSTKKERPIADNFISICSIRAVSSLLVVAVFYGEAGKAR